MTTKKKKNKSKKESKSNKDIKTGEIYRISFASEFDLGMISDKSNKVIEVEK